MFGSKDDKNPPAEAGNQAQPVSEEKKSLFSWWRKKPAESATESTQPAPVELVSYTHLDVYKRQGRRRLMAPGASGICHLA